MERWIPDATTVSAWFDDNRSTHPWQRACELHSIASAAAQEVTASGFERVCFIRTDALVRTDNAASVRMSENAGYQREGPLRRAVLQRGAPVNHFLYAALFEG